MTKTIKSLQSGRAVACILVLMLHLGEDFETLLKDSLIHNYTHFGGIGVIYFFVLSGFIIFHSHSGDIGNPERAINYIKKRIIRIYPIYWVVLLVVLVKVAIAGNSQTFIPDSLYSWIATFLLLPQQHPTDPSLNIGGVFSPINGVAWSLQYEVLYYIYFCILIVQKNVGVVIALVIASLYLIGFVYNIFPFSILNHPYLLIFGFGVGCAWISRYKIQSIYLLISGLLGLVVIYRSIVIEMQLTTNNMILGVGIGFCLVIIALVGLEKQGFLIGGEPLVQLIGAASYSIFLIHAPLLHLIVKALSRFHINRALLTPLFIALSIIAIFVGIIAHKFIELPLIRYCKKLISNQSITSAP